MAEPPFKYTIQFPENGNQTEDDTTSFEIIHSNDAEVLTPVIILLGWAGCQEKHLAKYSTMYEKKGFITLSLTVAAKTLFFRAHKIIQVAQGLLAILIQNNIASHPIIFHIFSNGGSLVYSQLITLINSPESEYYHKLSIRGIIFDSAPGKRRLLNAVKAFMSTIQNFNFVFRYLMGFCLLLYLVITRIFLHLLPIDLGSGKGFQLYESICQDPTQCPQLFLYSRADKVILAEDVEEVMSRREEKGVLVKSVCWDDSDHVAHWRAHPEVYGKACLDFITRCLASHQANM